MRDQDLNLIKSFETLVLAQKESEITAKMFMDSQKEFNANVSIAMKEMAKTASKSETLQVEVSGQQKQLYDARSDISKNKESISALETKLAVTDSLIVKFDKIADIFNRSIIGVFFVLICAIANQVYQSNNNSNDELISKLTQAIGNKSGAKNE